MSKDIKRVVKILNEGGIVLYPTEGVYGLGCDSFNETSVLRLLKLKKRKIEKGLILVASSWAQVKNLVKGDPAKNKLIKEKKGEPITWVFSATKRVPKWIKGEFDTVAIRVTDHPTAKRICQKFGGPIVSTSANISKNEPIKKIVQIDKRILDGIDAVVSGSIGGLGKPTEICDAITGKRFRESKGVKSQHATSKNA